ncbi:MAG TPA: hypothetical protein VLT59_06065, partial [Steroidobacteraceae bacterium]|nr:hypothetical protein [Steroidobacteraceae bacterium]
MTDPDSEQQGLRNTIYRQVTRSQRRLTPLRRLGYRIAVPIALAVLRLLWWSSRQGPIRGDAHLERVIREQGALIP